MRCIPASISAELRSPAPPGQRHAQVARLVCKMARARVSASAMFSVLRPCYAEDFTDSEINSLIGWAISKTLPQGSRRSCHKPVVTRAVKRTSTVKKGNSETARQEAIELVRQRVSGITIHENDLQQASPVSFSGRGHPEAEAILSNLFSATDRINIVAPFGYGQTRDRAEWLNAVRQNRLPTSSSGTFIRMNPVDGDGIADANVTAFRFALLESDCLPLDLQCALLATLPLPIAAIVDSGGKSLHAWIRIDAPSAEIFRTRLQSLFALVAPFGFDQATANPSRLARLPGLPRIDGARQDSTGQRLLYCAPDAVTFKPIIL